MNLLNFVYSYPDEQSCRESFKAYRNKQGLYVLNVDVGTIIGSGTRSNECKKCHTRQSLHSHTVMHGSQLPFRYWFIAMYLLTFTKKSFSALEL